MEAPRCFLPSKQLTFKIQQMVKMLTSSQKQALVNVFVRRAQEHCSAPPKPVSAQGWGSRSAVQLSTLSYSLKASFQGFKPRHEISSLLRGI